MMEREETQIYWQITRLYLQFILYLYTRDLSYVKYRYKLRYTLTLRNEREHKARSRLELWLSYRHVWLYIRYVEEGIRMYLITFVW